MILQLAVSLFRENFKKYNLSLIALVFSSLLMVYEFSSFLDLRGRSTAFVKEIDKGDFWVCLEDSSDLEETLHNALAKLKNIKGIQDCSPLVRVRATWQQKNGKQEECLVIGVDPSKELGLPAMIEESQAKILKDEKSLLVNSKLLKGVQSSSQQKKYQVHFQEGVMEIGGTFSSQAGGAPRFYTSLAGVQSLKDVGHKESAFILVKAKHPSQIPHLRMQIESALGLSTKTIREVENRLFKEDLLDSTEKGQMSVLIGLSLLFMGFVLVILFTEISKTWKGDLFSFRANGAGFLQIGYMSFLACSAVACMLSSISFALYCLLSYFLPFFPAISLFGIASIFGFFLFASFISSIISLFSIKDIYQEVA